ncbi:hypothetical protein [Massilia sp. ZL223]|uniref:hypothetical protein n=1 Tax=Massilia sp. ZL223 TaxID=2824904 RepID=UPI001B838167|nr:hypothetical protein [Massilia sp. ZL223]MBQ5965154.1 hypothetical protein [Massilia sp. ZL223]
MKWSTLNPVLARRRYGEMAADRSFVPAELTAEYASLREQLLQAIPHFDMRQDTGVSRYDVAAGLALYRILGAAGLDVRTAADDGVWRFLSLKVVPDLVAGRWPQLQEDRFWRGRSRIWLRTVWWLVHLTWQGSAEATEAILSDVTADTIVQLVERPGRGGFRIELTRALFRERSRRKLSQTAFRALMKLNTARVVVTEPTFCDGGVDGYVGELHAYIFGRAGRPRQTEG